MELWLAVVLFIVCIGGAVTAGVRYRKSRKVGFIVLAVAASLLAVATLVYTGLTLILIDNIIDEPVEQAIETITPATPAASETTKTSNPVAIPAVDNAIMAIDAHIDRAIEMIAAGGGDNQSAVTFGYEPKLAYDDLNDEDKAMYDDMLLNAQSLTPFSFTAAEHGYEVMDRSLAVYDVLKDDYPEIEIYFMLRDVLDGSDTVAIESVYFMPQDAEMLPVDTDTLREEIARFDAVCERIVERMPENLSACDQYRYLAVVISLVTTYDYDFSSGWQDSTAYGAVMGGHSICQGYSRGFLYLCRKAGLWCETVSGVAGGNEAHMWNMVKLDFGTYHVDITWCDEQGTPGGAEWERYFMLTQEEILQDHEITDGKIATGTPDISVVYSDPAEPDIPAEPANLTEQGNTPGEPAMIIVNGVDLKAEVKPKVIDDTLYAEGSSFIEALRDLEMHDGMHDFNYQYETDSDMISTWLTEFDYDRGSYVREEFETLLHNDAIVVTSYFTDTPLFILFIDSTDVVSFVVDEGFPVLIHMNEAPCIIGGEVYIPMQAFTDLTGHEIVIE